jgi:hypothetical protein
MEGIPQDLISREIRRLERQEAELYEDAHNAYWCGHKDLCQKFEYEIKKIQARLIYLESRRPI